MINTILWLNIREFRISGSSPPFSFYRGPKDIDPIRIESLILSRSFFHSRSLVIFSFVESRDVRSKCFSILLVYNIEVIRLFFWFTATREIVYKRIGQ